MSDYTYVDQRANIAHTFGNVYYAGEMLWFLLWFAAMISLESLTSGVAEEQYELENTLTALHGFALPALVYYFEGGMLSAMLIPIFMVVGTDLNAIIHVVRHTPRTLTWAWALLVAIPSYGMFLNLVALLWIFIVRYYYKISFEKKRPLKRPIPPPFPQSAAITRKHK